MSTSYWITIAAILPFRWIFPRTIIFDSIFTSSVDKLQKAIVSSPSAFSMSRLRPIVTGGIRRIQV
eukprot:5470850-Pleurochrysis_carterae.AAC.5